MFGFGRKKDVYDTLYGKGARLDPSTRPADPAPGSTIVAVNTLPAASPRFGDWHGEKFPGGLGPADVLFTDYWTLRARSASLFKTNLFARGLIRRIVDNLINTGLHLESTPEESVLGYPKNGLSEWSEKIEVRFGLWADTPKLCDHYHEMTFGELQEFAKRESLVCGDILVVLRQDAKTSLPSVQLVPGDKVRTPFSSIGSKTAKIEHGIELDADRRHIAYWVEQADGTSKRLPAYGEKTGRRQAWMVYGADRRFSEVRGEPLLSLMVQSLREIDRYRDSTQRKATINSMLAMYIKKGEDKPGSRPITGAAIRRGTDVAADVTGTARSFRTMEQIPGLVLDELAHGEEPHGFQPNGTDEKYGDFEASILAGVAFANGVPPEIYRLFFSSNYSASQAAINEFKLVLNRDRTRFGGQFCTPIYHEWTLAEALTRRIEAPGLLEAWRDPLQYATLAAWLKSDWSGHIKPAVDLSKLVRGYKEMIAEGLITRGRATRELTGMRFSQVVQQLATENAQLAEALRPLQEMEAEVEASFLPEPDSEPDDINKEDDDSEAPPKRTLRVVGEED